MVLSKQTPTLLFITVLFLLVSCQTNIELIDNEQNNTLLPDEQLVRPIIDRSQPPMNPPEQPRQTTPSPPAPGTNQSPILGPRDYRTFNVPINTSLGALSSTIGLEELPLLRPAAIQTGDNHFRGYRQLIHFNQETIIPVFVHDDYRREEYLGDALFFRTNKAYMNYTVIRNNNRPFYDDTLVGSDLLLAGRTYKVMEASNHSLVLNGVDIEQHFVFTHNRTLESNRQTIPQSSVYYQLDTLNYYALAQDIDDQGFFLRPGETLKARTQEPGAFIGDLNLRYDGLEPLKGTTLRLRAFDERIALQWDTSEGVLSLPLLGRAANGSLIHGDRERVHFTECISRTDGCVAPNDILVMHASTPQETLTRLLRVSTINPDTQRIHLRDVQTREQLYIRYEQNNPRQQPYADLSFLGKNYRLYVVNTTIQDPDNLSANISVANRLSVDLTGNNNVRGEHTPLFIGPLRVTLNNPLPQGHNHTSYALNISLETTPFTRAQQQDNKGTLNKEQLLIQAVYEDDQFLIRTPTAPANQLWNQRLYQLRDDRDAYAMSLWGSELRVTDGLQDTTRDVTITVPHQQRLAQISIGRLE